VNTSPPPSLATWLNRSRTPLLATSTVATVIVFVLTEVGPTPELTVKYHVAFRVVNALMCLTLLIAMTVRRPSRHAKFVAIATWPVAVAQAVFVTNGMVEGLSRGVSAVACAATLTVSITAILLDVETARDRPVNRL
jgi:hypothetical protein